MAEHTDPVAAHREQHGRRHEEEISRIAEPGLRADLNERVAFYYRAWSHALKKAAAERYNDSPRIYERKLSERRIDPRLIPKEQKEEMRQEAIREAVAISRMRIDDINRTVPAIIEKTIADTVTLNRLPAKDNRVPDPGRERDTGRGR